MKKIAVICFGSFLLCFTCVPDPIEDNKRALVNVEVVNSTLSGLENISVKFNTGEVQIVQNQDENIFLQDEFLLASQFTNSNGISSFVSLAPRGGIRDSYVVINPKEFDENNVDPNSNLETVAYLIEDENLDISLPQTILREKTPLTVRFINNSNTADFIRYVVTFSGDTNLVSFPSGAAIGEVVIEDSIVGEETFLERTFSTVIGSNATLEYQIFQNNEVTQEDIITIAVTEINQLYEFEY